MSDYNGNNEQNGTLAETPDSNSEPKLEDLKRGPPVAPKPAWVRQSLKSIKSGKSPAEAFKNPERRNQDSGRTFGVGLRTTSSGRNQSIKQKISSFETFSGTDGGGRATASSSGLLSKDKSPSLAKVEKVENAEKLEPNKSWRSRSNVIDTDEAIKSSSSSISATSSEPETSSLEQVTPESVDTNMDTPKPDVLTEDTTCPPEDPAPTLDNEEDLESPKLGPCPRRSSSSKDLPSGSSHTPSLRTRSLPLNTSSSLEAHSQGGLEGDSLEIILSFTNQVSHALMRSMQSLPQSPCIKLGNPWNSPAGSSHSDLLESDGPEPQMPLTDSSEKNFSVRYIPFFTTIANKCLFKSCPSPRGTSGCTWSAYSSLHKES